MSMSLVMYLLCQCTFPVAEDRSPSTNYCLLQ